VQVGIGGVAVQIGTGEWPCRLVRASGCAGWYGRVAVQIGTGEWPCRLVRASGRADWYGRVAVQIGTGEWLFRVAAGVTHLVGATPSRSRDPSFTLVS
jgi:hypothetical protein